MARQSGVIKIKGLLDDISFYENKLHGRLIRKKTGAKKKQIQKGKEFVNVRRNMNEFGRGSSCGKLIRHSFHALEKHCKDGTMHNKLMKRMRELILMDDKSEWGNRKMTEKGIQQFRHFELDSKSLSSQYFDLPVNTEASKGQLDIYAGISIRKITRDVSAWKIISVAASLDLENEQRSTDTKESELYSFEKGSYGLSFRHYYDEDRLLFHGMCIVLYSYDAVIDEYVPTRAEHVNAGFVRYVG